MNFRKTLALLGCAVLMGTASLSAQVKIKDGNKIAFMGDSITQFGHNYAAGYVNMVMIGLKVNGIKADFVKAGISGNRSTHMLARLDRDVISKKTQVMTLSCGVNDVWHGKRGVKLEDYKKNIRQIVDKATAAGIPCIPPVAGTTTLFTFLIILPLRPTSIDLICSGSHPRTSLTMEAP